MSSEDYVARGWMKASVTRTQLMRYAAGGICSFRCVADRSIVNRLDEYRWFGVTGCPAETARSRLLSEEATGEDDRNDSCRSRAMYVFGQRVTVR